MDVEQALLEKYRTGQVLTTDGKSIRIHSAVSADESAFMVDLIRSDTTVVRTLEVGCNYGFSALSICGATKGRPGALHTIIDPFQDTD